MGKKEKLIRRLKSKPKDFTFDEAVILLDYQVKQLVNFLEQEGHI